MWEKIKDLGNGLIEVRVFGDNGIVFCKYQELNGKKHGKEILYCKNRQIIEKRIWVDGKLKGIIKK